MTQFVFKATWYNDYRDKETVSCGIIFAEDYADAVKKIDKRLPSLFTLEIQICLEGDEFIWVGETIYNQLKTEDEKVFYTNEEFEEEYGKNE